MAITELLRTTEKAYSNDKNILSTIIRLPFDKQYIKVGLKIHPDDKAATGIKIQLMVQAKEGGKWIKKAWLTFDSYGPKGHINKYGVVNPNPHLRFECGNLNDKDIRIAARSNGARFRLVVGGMSRSDWNGDIVKGDEA